MPAGIIGHRKTRAPRRSALQDRPTPIKVTSVSIAAAVLTVVFDQHVTLRGVPQYTTDLAGPRPVSAELAAPNAVAVTFDAPIATATSVTIPYEDPGVRNATGGYVMPYPTLSLP